jgi:hypothetical protein
MYLGIVYTKNSVDIILFLKDVLIAGKPNPPLFSLDFIIYVLKCQMVQPNDFKLSGGPLRVK